MAEFRQKRGKTEERYWLIKRKGDRIFKEWGAIVNGEHRRHGGTEDVPGAKGKPNTKAFVSAEDNAVFNMEREIRGKVEEGYVKLGEESAANTGDSLDFSKPLPKNICFSKPQQKVPAKFSNIPLLCTRKMNGQTVVIYKDENGHVDLLSRRMEDLNGHFPHLMDAATNYLPSSTIILAEGYMGKGNTHRDLMRASTIFRSKPELAVEKQEKTEYMHFYVFRIPFWNGDPLEATQGSSILDHGAYLASIQNRINSIGDAAWTLEPPKIRKFDNAAAALEHAKEHGYEGYVAYVPGHGFDGDGITFHGKAGRPNHTFKIKVPETDDFILCWNPDKGTKEKPLGTWGTGKNMGLCGTLSAYQYNELGELIYCGNVGSGLSDEDKKGIATLVKGSGRTFKCVGEVAFEFRSSVAEGDKSNSLQIPRLERIRDDKRSRECICEGLRSSQT